MAEGKKRRAVGRDDQGLVICQRLGQPLDEVLLGLAVHGAGRFVEEQQFAGGNDGAGKREEGALSAGEAAAPFTYRAIETARVARKDAILEIAGAGEEPSPAVSIEVLKISESNTVAVADSVRKVLTELEAVLPADRDPDYIVASGAPLAGASDWTLTGALTYRAPVTDEHEFLFFIDGRWQTEARTQTLNRDPVTDQDAFAVFSARAGIGRIDKTWKVEAYVRNLFDEYYHLAGFAVPEQTGVYAAYPGEPRTWGISLRSEF